jgi:hypothetical protein
MTVRHLLVLNNTDSSGIAYVIEFPTAEAMADFQERTNPDSGDRPLRFRAEEGTTSVILTPEEALAELTHTAEEPS